MRIKEEDYPIEWITEAVMMDILNLFKISKTEETETDEITVSFFKKEITHLYRLMKICVPNLPEECFVRYDDGTIATRLGIPEIFNFVFEAFEKFQKKRVSDIESLLSKEGLTKEQIENAQALLQTSEKELIAIRQKINDTVLGFFNEMQLTLFANPPAETSANNPALDPASPMRGQGRNKKKRRRVSN